MTDETMSRVNDLGLTISATVDRLEADKAVIKTSDGQEIIWPIEKLPEGITEGSSIKLGVCSDDSEKLQRQKLAKAILNEIFEGKSSEANQKG